MQAEFVRDLDGFRGTAKLWHLSAYVFYENHYGRRSTQYVVTSATEALDTGKPETYIFPADSDGQIVSWLELPGSFRGSLDHDRAIGNLLAAEDGTLR